MTASGDAPCDSPLEDEAVVAALTRPEAYAGAGVVPAASVEAIQTHLSHVFLCGERVYKFRKRVSLGFVDFRARAERNADCLREVALNRRLAPDVYLGVAPLEVAASRVRVGAPRESLAASGAEHCVVMRRLPRDRDALTLLERGALAPAQIDRIAARIARFHDEHGLGTPAPYSQAEWLAHCTRPAVANFGTLREFAKDPEDRRRLERLESLCLGFARERADRFEARRRRGLAIDAHGDLHLAHVWFERDDAEPLAIDCLEFDAELRRIDAASEVAFLAMDLAYRGADALAERFLRVYAGLRDDFDLYRVVDWFASYRAAVRAKVAAIAAGEREIDAAQRARAAESASRHLALALSHLEAPRSPRLVLVGGAVGSGKTTVSDALADALGAAVVSSDRVRKQRLGLAPGEHAAASAYTSEAKSAVYEAMLERAEPVWSSGRAVVLDATFGARRERERVRERAQRAGVPVFFVETRCDAEVATSRLEQRRRAGRDASDAGPELVAASRAAFERLDEWPASERAVIDTTPPGWRADLESLAARLMALRGSPAPQ
ncbi:MAG TPA: AAA family ATPase [Myxococcota bacterium]|nr:AAA family ATPase [Myxococcota bacterium]